MIFDSYPNECCESRKEKNANKTMCCNNVYRIDDAIRIFILQKLHQYWSTSPTEAAARQHSLRVYTCNKGYPVDSTIYKVICSSRGGVSCQYQQHFWPWIKLQTQAHFLQVLERLPIVDAGSEVYCSLFRYPDHKLSFSHYLSRFPD